MKGRNFRALLEDQWADGKFVCVGLDSEFSKIPQSLHQGTVENTIVAFNRAIVTATSDIVCAYKLNLAFYLVHGTCGLAALHRSIVDIHIQAPNIPVILDAKWADIGNTNLGYAEAAFDFLQADAITVHPYLGAEALQPFLRLPDKGIIVLCRTSNPGAEELQDLTVYGEPLYLFVARQVARVWNRNGNCALVVGATYPHELAKVRQLVGNMPILIPGIGAQGGDLKATVKAGMDNRGCGMIINSSRAIIFASGGDDFAQAARKSTLELRTLINTYREKRLDQ